MIRYRRDIDGLRAIAVLLVIGFHAFPKYVRGGFVGVDVFFVISGFLISGIILKKLESNTFSFYEFYSHRIRRIFPALILVLFTCLALGMAILMANEYSVLGKHIFSAAGFFSNFSLKGEAGYFDSAADYKPLLHLWSLGVEEQFYIFWPLLLVFANRFRIPFIYCALGIASLSFGLNVGRLHRFPFEVYYLPHTRTWELLTGAILAHLKSRNSHKNFFLCANFQAVFGIALIIFSAFALSKETHFPGFAALLPVIGSYLLVWSGEEAWFNRTILGSPLLVTIGLMSYPLYLWHWPLLSFLRILGETDSATITLALALSFLLAWLTFEYFEKPIRQSKQTSSQLLSLVCAMILAGFLGLYIHTKEGAVSSRLANTLEIARELEIGRGSRTLISGKLCVPEIARVLSCESDTREKPSFLVIGDSQSSAFFHGLVKVSAPGERWANVWGPSLMFLEGLKWKDKNYDRDFRIGVQTLADSHFKLILIVNALYTLEDDYKSELIDKQSSIHSYLEGFSGMIERLERSGNQVALMIPVPWTRLSPIDCLYQRPFSKGRIPACSIPLKKHEKELEEVRKMYAELKRRHPRLLIYDPTPALCPGGLCPVLMSSKTLYRDGFHLSDFGAEIVAEDFLRWMHQQQNILHQPRK